jgi:hypothetical protein
MKIPQGEKHGGLQASKKKFVKMSKEGKIFLSKNVLTGTS